MFSLYNGKGSTTSHQKSNTLKAKDEKQPLRPPHHLWGSSCSARPCEELYHFNWTTKNAYSFSIIFSSSSKYSLSICSRRFWSYPSGRRSNAGSVVMSNSPVSELSSLFALVEVSLEIFKAKLALNVEHVNHSKPRTSIQANIYAVTSRQPFIA